MQFLRWSFCLFANFLEGEITMLKFNSKDRVVTDATLAKQIAGKEKSEVSNKECHPRLHFLFDAFMTPFTGVLLFLALLSFLTNYLFVPADQKDLSTVIIMITI